MAAGVLGALGFGVWQDWQQAIVHSGAMFQSHAQTAAVPLESALLHAERLAEVVDELLVERCEITPQELRSSMGTRLKAGEIVDVVYDNRSMAAVTTSDAMSRESDPIAEFEVVRTGVKGIVGPALERGGQWVLPVAVRKRDWATVIVNLQLREVVGDWTTNRGGADVAVTLVGVDGRVMLTHPLRQEAIGRMGSRGTVVAGGHADSPFGEAGGFAVRLSDTGERVLVGWSRVPGTQLAVTVSSTLHDVNKSWLLERGWLFGALGLILVSASSAARSWLRRSRQAALAERDLMAERSARVEAESRSAAKTAFLSSMSHEIRTPLNAVIGYAQIINRDQGMSAEEIRDRVKKIEKAGWHLLELIDDVLDLAAVEAGATNLDRKPILLREIVEQALELIEAAAEARTIAVSMKADETWVVGDARRVRQVVSNLVSNAVKYNVDGGHVEVTVERVGGMGAIRVRDSGLGMTRGQMMRLYQPFNRLGREDSGVKGTGIGLSITKALVERMGGELHVTSEPGKGSSFEVTLPCADVRTPVAEAKVTMPETEAVKAEVTDVLCVEDNDVNAMVLQESIRFLRPHWRFERAESLVVASRMVRERQPELVFLDQQLPDGEGLTWLEREAQAGTVARDRVVLITADAMPALKARVSDSGVRHFLSKPFEMAALADLLAQVDAREHVQGESASGD